MALVPTEMLFAQITDNAETLTQSFIRQYRFQQTHSGRSSALFDDWFEQTSVGVKRLKQQYFDGAEDNHQLIKGMSAFIGKSDEPLDDERKARIVAATLTLNELGPAWSKVVSNSHLSMPENALIMYSEDSAWGRIADENLIMTDYSVLRSSLQSQNPERAPNWTGLYYDASAGVWTITYQHPIDLNGRHLANASFDVELGKLLNDLQTQRDVGANYMVLNNQGDLIAASDISENLKNQPLLSHDNYDDPLYQSVYGLINTLRDAPSAEVFENAVPGHLVILQQIPRLQWWYVALYPQDGIREQASIQPLRLSITGLLILGLLLLIVHWQVTREVSLPLRRLASVASQMDAKNYQDVIASSDRQWRFKGEVKLALDAFRTMARRFVNAQHSLEKQVSERTAELAQANKRLQHLAHIDGLTGLMNRRSFDRDLQKVLSEHTPFILALADIDAFKPFNDHYGHEAGDRVLQQVSQCLLSLDGVMAYRYGGEEFALLIPKAVINANALFLTKVVEKVAALQIPHEYNSRKADVVSISMGAVMVTPDSAPAEIINQADEKLYKAKEKGGNCVESNINTDSNRAFSSY
ncbi:GGDEF domain-containing protein [Lacimicrobium alkaliphilum]|uniref:diguanylate cyclase n=2 Tax=Lacimicrobium alkaliphilum TaxID=1526571 RepID=A0ABQ1R4U5_9ALTE|nr:GGDEF domain-containing protein [Lacimicrobium alkaliphilum]